MLIKIRSKLMKRQGQSSAEYAAVIALIVAATVTMGTFIRRAMMARMAHEANQVDDQYEPYYAASEQSTVSESNVLTFGDETTAQKAETSKQEGTIGDYQDTAPVPTGPTPQQQLPLLWHIQ